MYCTNTLKQYTHYDVFVQTWCQILADDMKESFSGFEWIYFVTDILLTFTNIDFFERWLNHRVFLWQIAKKGDVIYGMKMGFRDPTSKNTHAATDSIAGC